MSRVLAAIAAAHWAIQPETLETILGIAAREIALEPEALAAKLGRPLDKTYDVTVRDGVATIPLTGPLFRYANLITMFSGATAVGLLATDFRAALENPEIRAIVLAIDSPGGELRGINEFAGQVRAARGIKPVIAYVSGTGASGAYWIATAADRVVLDATAMVGSIGVVTTFLDDKARLERQGVKAFEFVSSQSPDKRVDPASEPGRAKIQALVDRLADEFVAAVAANRGVAPATVLADFGRGGVLVGADAVAAGMADAVGSYEDIMAGLLDSRLPHFTLARGATPLEASMTNTPITAASLRASHPDIVAALLAEGAAGVKPAALSLEAVERDAPAIAASLRAAGAAAERARIKEIRDSALPGHDALVEQLIDSGAEPGAAAKAILAAEKQSGAKVLDQLKDEGAKAKVPPAPIESGDRTAVDPALPIEARAKAEWDADPKLRGQFAALEHYLAVRKAEDAGSVRYLRLA